ncbi:hypothetical protein PX554_00875 [Sphingomonas sp. H39-1-10]|uniref:hypothetical protein n=1 Tax=Sphingomonas pollutisoli TaxID=3030829 RepID=UPI0023B9479D|nr:hypothetical protein [Sphingomonas pollutisoli]MDF0486667.1 hypothetical protein [Sphingomonas pollutisoli]
MSIATRIRLIAIAALAAQAAPVDAQEHADVPGSSLQNSPPGAPIAPDWAYPQSTTHAQVGPPPGFHRDSRVEATPVGVFEGQADVGAAVAPGSASFANGTYTIRSAGYNVWYTRDEFRFLFKKMSGDVSMAADIAYPAGGFGDHKALLVIRQSLEDDAKEAFVALHGDGMIHLAQRPEPGKRISDMEYRIGSRGGLPGGKSPDSLVTLHAKRIGIEKRGDQFMLWVSEQGEPMHQYGAPITLHVAAPFYVGIGFASHLPGVVETATLSNVVLENRAGRVR